MVSRKGRVSIWKQLIKEIYFTLVAQIVNIIGDGLIRTDKRHFYLFILLIPLICVAAPREWSWISLLLECMVRNTILRCTYPVECSTFSICHRHGVLISRNNITFNSFAVAQEGRKTDDTTVHSYQYFLVPRNEQYIFSVISVVSPVVRTSRGTQRTDT
jgi:hypothetical protein